VSQFFIRLW